MARRSLIALAIAVLAGLTALGAVADGNTSSLRSGSTATLAVIGDVPYTEAQVVAFPSWISEMNADPDVETAVHLGDIKSGSTVCSDAYFSTIAGFFATFADPLVFTPGDNEWTDCHRLNNGAYNPLERLAKLREVFFPKPGTTLGKKVRIRDQPKYPENVLWKDARAVFAAVHVVGSNNSLAPWTGNTAPTPEQQAEVDARIDAALRWINQAFDSADASAARGVVLMMQADTFEGSNETLSGFTAILDRIEDRAAAFGKPVLLLQGDTHVYLEDKPFTAAPNVTRVVVEGSTEANEWLKLTVDPRSPDVFSWERIDF